MQAPKYLWYSPKVFSRSSSLNRSTSSSSSNRSIEKSAGAKGTSGTAPGDGHSSSTPQLPDEIILHIFELLREDVQDSEDYSGIAAGANSYLRVNRRFYSILRSSWFSALFDTRSKASARLVKVLQQPLILTWIREVSIAFESDSPPYEEFANLNRLLNLHKVDATFDYLHEEEQVIEVTRLLRPLASLPKLVDFRFSSTLKTSFVSFSLVKIAPNLQSLRLVLEDTCQRLSNVFTTCPDTLRRLEMDTAESMRDHEWAAIPWRTIEGITVRSSPSTSPSSTCKRGLFDALENALYPVTPRTELFTAKRISLKSLKLTYGVRSKSEVLFDLRDLYDVLELLRPTSIKTLEIKLSGGNDQEWGVPIALPSLEKLTLCGLHSLRDGANFATLRRIICSFPSLRVLHLRWFMLCKDSPITNAISELSRGGLAFTYPELGGILLYLEEDTQVLEVIYHEFDAQEWIKWSRVNPPEQFKKELYRNNLK